MKEQPLSNKIWNRLLDITSGDLWELSARYLWFVWIASALRTVPLCLISEVWRKVGGGEEEGQTLFAYFA